MPINIVNRFKIKLIAIVFIFLAGYLFSVFVNDSLASGHGSCFLSGVPPPNTCSYSVTCFGGSGGFPADVNVRLDDVFESHFGFAYKLVSVTGSHTLAPGQSGTIWCDCDHTYDDGTGGYSGSVAAGVSCPAGPICGNGNIDPGEQCDGTNFGGQTCGSFGYSRSGGSLSCTNDCQTIDTSGCGRAKCLAPLSCWFVA